jgi:hypothetical protein
MPLKLETSGVSFEVGKAVDSRSDRDTGRQRVEKAGRPRGLVQLIVHDEQTGSEIVTVTVAGEQPNVTVKQPVRGLEAIPWVGRGEACIAKRAEAITPRLVDR